jgi:flagellar hook-length control protein FliK
MMSMDIAAIGAAPPLPDASCASTGTPDGKTGFAALLDEAACTDGESLDAMPPSEKGDADDEDALAALAITSLLSLDAPVKPPVDAVDVEIAGTGEVGDAAAFLEVTKPDALIELSAETDGDQALAGAEGASKETAAVPNADVRTAARTDVTAGGPDSPPSATELPSKSADESPVTIGAAADAAATRGQSDTPAGVDAHTARAAKSAPGIKPARADRAQAKHAAIVYDQTPVAQAAANAAKHTAGDTAQVDGRKNMPDAPAASSTAARLARALERAAALNNESAAAGAVAATDGSSGQPSSFGDASAERDTPSFGAPRQATGSVTFTIAAPTPFDIRTLARAADAASHATETSAAEIPERDVVAQLVQSMRVQFRDGIGEAVVRLKPEHLGAVQVSLKIENGAITATVQADVASVRHWLESQQETLRTSLAEQGLRLERFVVEADGQRRAARDDAQPRERRRQQQRRREDAAMSGTDHPVFEITV